MESASNVTDFFISYTSVDVTWATWIAQQVEAAGYTTLYQARDFHAGGVFPLQMDQAMRGAKRTIAVLSPEYLRSRYCAPEWAEAFRRDPTGEYALLVPVRVRACDLGGVFGARVYIDLVDADEETKRPRLLKGIEDAASKALPPAPPPGVDTELPVRPLVAAPTGLPLSASLVGRETELADLLAKLRAGTTSGVFALEGMGGVGKTALAAEAVARLAEDLEAFPGGAAWIACEGLAGEAGLADLWAKVALAVGLEQVTVQADPQLRRMMLAAALAQGQRLLLALDNVEPGLDAEAVLETLAVRNHTALLLTARQRVAPHRVAAIDLAPLQPDGARTLFLAQLARNGGTPPTSAEEPVLAALLEAVGGLPLALELTAAYAGVQRLAMDSVLREVKQDGLTAAAFRADPKRALLVRFERSWKALTPRQQRVFAGLSLLAGVSFPRAAALAVGHATLAKRPADPQGDLLTLVSYALVEALPGGERLRLHPLLREYAAGKLKTLAQVQQERLGKAMVAYWLAYAEAHPGYEGMDALETEAVGLMGALEWAHEHARHREVLELAHAMMTAWGVRGRRDEGQLIYTWADSAAQQLGDLGEQQWTAFQVGLTHWRAGQIGEARASYERALALAQQLGDSAEETSAICRLAMVDQRAGRVKEARAGFELTLKLAEEQGNQEVLLEGLNGLAVLNVQTGHVAEARAGYERALQLAQQLKDPRMELPMMQNLAVLDKRTGLLAKARVGYERVLRLAQQLKDPAAEWSATHELAVLDARLGWLKEARIGVERALKLANVLGDPSAERAEIHELAVLDDRTGQVDRAQANYERALELARQLGDLAGEAMELSNFGLFLWHHHEPDRGRKLIMQSLAINKKLGDSYMMGICHQYLGKIDEAEVNRGGAIEHYRRALRCLEQVQAPEAEKVRGDLRRLGEQA